MPDINVSLSSVANIVLSLLLIFQWYKSRAREDAVKNGLFAVREMVGRMDDPASPNVLDALDANLATLGARRPFMERCKRMMIAIWAKFQKTEETPLSEISPVNRASLKD